MFIVFGLALPHKFMPRHENPLPIEQAPTWQARTLTEPRRPALHLRLRLPADLTGSTRTPPHLRTDRNLIRTGSGRVRRCSQPDKPGALLSLVDEHHRQHVRTLRVRGLRGGRARRGRAAPSILCRTLGRAGTRCVPPDPRKHGADRYSLVGPKTREEPRLPRYRGNQGRGTSAGDFAGSMTSRDPRLATSGALPFGRAETRIRVRAGIRG
jgi:hypothetical protein